MTALVVLMNQSFVWFSSRNCSSKSNSSVYLQILIIVVCINLYCLYIVEKGVFPISTSQYTSKRD